jgi:hypothetical protein
MNCGTFFDVRTSDKFALKSFSFENIDVKDEAKNGQFSAKVIDDTRVSNLVVNGKRIDQ